MIWFLQNCLKWYLLFMVFIFKLRRINICYKYIDLGILLALSLSKWGYQPRSVTAKRFFGWCYYPRGETSASWVIHHTWGRDLYVTSPHYCSVTLELTVHQNSFRCPFSPSILWFADLPWRLSGKESACQRRRCGFDPWLGRFSGEGNGNPLQYSCLESPVDRGTCRATDHGVSKESDTT